MFSLSDITAVLIGSGQATGHYRAYRFGNATEHQTNCPRRSNGCRGQRVDHGSCSRYVLVIRFAYIGVSGSSADVLETDCGQGTVSS